MSGAATSDGPVLDRAVAIGGGHGQARTLLALRTLARHVTAVATVADDGGSSGRLRRGLRTVPPGDLRMALIALAEDERVRELLSHRFTEGEVAGHSLGNLVILAAAATTGSVVDGLRCVARLAGSTPDGAPVVGQATIAATPGLVDVRLVGDEPAACPEAVAAIAAAELLVLGPGSVVTSVLPNLLVPGIAEAVATTDATTVFVAKLGEQ